MDESESVVNMMNSVMKIRITFVLVKVFIVDPGRASCTFKSI